MYHLLAGLYSEWARPSTSNVLLVGPSGSGKTALLARLRHRVRPADAAAKLPLGGEAGPRVKGLPSTVGQNVLDFRPPSAPSGVQVRLWDLGGAPALRSIWTRYLGETHVLIWAIDVRLWDEQSSAGGGNGKEKARDAEEERDEAWDALAAILPQLSPSVPLIVYVSDLGHFGALRQQALEALEDAGEAANTEAARAAAAQALVERAGEAIRRLREEYTRRLEGVGREASFVEGWSDASIEELLQMLSEHAVRRKQR